MRWIGGAVLGLFACGQSSEMIDGSAAPDAATDADVVDVVDAGSDTMMVDAGCGDTTTSQNCGACGHDCLGGACVAGACQPVLVASDPDNASPWDMKVAGANLVFTNFRQGSTLARVSRVDKGAVAGNITLVNDYAGYLQLVDGFPTLLDVSTTDYWVAITSGREMNGKWGGGFDRCPIATGCTTGLVADPYVTGFAIAVDGTNAFFTVQYSAQGNTEIRKSALDFTNQTTMAFNGGIDIAVDSTNMYYSFNGGTYSAGIYKCAKSAPCQGMGTHISKPNPASTIALTATRVYYFGPGTIERVDIAGGGDKTIATGLLSDGGVVVDDKYVYFADSGNLETKMGGKVVRCNLDGCSIGMTVLWSSDNPRALAGDEKAIYWGTPSGKIYRLAK